MLKTTLSENTLADIESLIADGIRESEALDYKENFYDLDAANEQYRVRQHIELLKDISSLANTDGGDLILGVDKNDGVASKIIGFETSSIDGLKQRVHQLAATWIEPSLQLAMHEIELSPKRFVLLLRVQRSIISPHRVIYQNNPGQFYARNSNGVYAMNTIQLRQAFTMSETVFERMKKFHINRTEEAARGFPLRLHEGPLLTMHLISPQSMTSRISLDVQPLHHRSMQLQLLGTSYKDIRYNADGVLVANNREDSGNAPVIHKSYIQLYRNGIFEAVASDIAYNPTPSSKALRLRNHYFLHMQDQLPKYIKFMLDSGIALPIWCFITFKDASRVGMHLQTYDPYYRTAIDRDELILPEQEITSPEFDAEAVLKPMFDVVWNAGGYAQSPTRAQILAAR